MLVSVAPHNTVNPVPAVTVFIAGGVVIVPPAAFRLICTSDVAISFVLLIVIVPPAVQTNVPVRAAITVKDEALMVPVASPGAPQTPIATTPAEARLMQVSSLPVGPKPYSPLFNRLCR